MLECKDLKVKLWMHDYLRTLTKSFNAIDDWGELMAYHKDGDLVTANPIFHSNSDIIVAPVQRSNANVGSAKEGSTYCL